MKVQEIVEMNSHDKQTIYEAYSIEHATRKHLNGELNEARVHCARLRFDAQYWQDEWLSQVVLKNVPCVGDPQAALDDYFAHPARRIIMTDDNGFYAFVDNGNHFFIYFAWTDPKAYKRERVAMVRLIKDLYAMGKPIRYTGVNNIMSSHSVEISPGLFELKF